MTTRIGPMKERSKVLGKGWGGRKDFPGAMMLQLRVEGWQALTGGERTEWEILNPRWTASSGF